MNQPVPKVDGADVERIVERDFSWEDRHEALEVLEQYTSNNGSPHRVHLAALKMSGGDLAQLREWIAVATTDYRDVLVAAEYPLADARRSALEEASDAERKAVYDADWKQYKEWLNGG